MIASFRNRDLERFWSKGDRSGLRQDWTKKIARMLNAIEAAREPAELGIPGFGFHVLTGDMAGRYSMIVSRNWRLTFAWQGENAVDLDLEDYHGK